MIFRLLLGSSILSYYIITSNMVASSENFLASGVQSLLPVRLWSSASTTARSSGRSSVQSLLFSLHIFPKLSSLSVKQSVGMWVRHGTGPVLLRLAHSGVMTFLGYVGPGICLGSASEGEQASADITVVGESLIPVFSWSIRPSKREVMTTAPTPLSTSKLYWDWIIAIICSIPSIPLSLMQRGKGCSSNTAGDGPGSEVLSGVEGAQKMIGFPPPYDADDYASWSENFLIALPDNLHLIAEGTETQPGPVTSVPEEKAKKRAKRIRRFLDRNKLLFQLLNCAISRSPRHSIAGKIYIQSAQRFDGKGAWEALKLHHNNPTSQNKLYAMRTLFDIKQLDGETVFEYKARLDKALARIQSLKVSMEDINIVLFLFGLLPKFTAFIDAMSLLESRFLTLDAVYDNLVSHEQRLTAESHAGMLTKAHSAAVPTATDQQAAISNLTDIVKALATQARNGRNVEGSNGRFGGRYRGGHRGGRGGGRDGGRLSGRPSPEERQGICQRCGLSGHAARTCSVNLNKRSQSPSAPPHKRPRWASGKMAIAESFPATVAFMARTGQNDDIKTSDIIMYADSGASRHIVKGITAKDMTNFQADSTTVETASGIVHAIGIGDYGSLRDALLVPDITASLFSISQACSRGLVAVFTHTGVDLYYSDQVQTQGAPVISGNQKDGMYMLNISESPVEHRSPARHVLQAFVADARPANSFELWHKRFGHISSNTLRTMQTCRAVNGLNFTKSEVAAHKRRGICSVCALGGLKMSAVRRTPSTASTRLQPGQLVCIDVLTSPTLSIGGSKYALVIVDAATRYLWVYFMKNKTESATKISEWLEWMKSHGIDAKAYTTIRTDGGGEFISADWSRCLASCGVLHELSPPYYHVHMVERALQTIQTMARSMLVQQKLSSGFWAEAVATAVHTLNRTPCKATGKRTRYELFHSVKPSVQHFRTFGCIVYAKVYDALRKKWDEKAFMGRFVGYDESSPKSWRVWNPSTKAVINTANVIFDEVGSHLGDVEVGKEELDALFVDQPSLDYSEPSIPVPSINPRQPRWDSDRVLRSSRPVPIVETVNHRALSAAERSVPNTFRQAMASAAAEQWREAIAAENNSLKRNNTFTILERPPGTRVLGLKWVFKVKEHADGTVERYKARCTALGNLQREGFDYDETFSPVVRYSTIRMLLAVASARNLVVHHMDVDTAFLYGRMPAENHIYVTIPEGFPIPGDLQGKPNLVARVDRAIYGLKQSPRLWNKTIDSTMHKHGFNRSAQDSCLYTRQRNGNILYVTIFVDDLVIAGTTLQSINEFKRELRQGYNMKDLGEISYCLGMEVTRDTDGHYSITQKKYIGDVLRRFGMLNCKPSPIPMETGLKLSKTMSPASPEEIETASTFPYREIIGSLMYLMVSTRPDISYAVGQLARYLNCHGPQHQAAATILLRYVKGTQQLGITFGTSDLSLTGYSDSDWAADVDTRRSTTGYIFMLAGGPISWKSKSQPTVALSSTEAEYMALTASAQEAISLKALCADFSIHSDAPVLIYGDNQGSLAMAQNPTMHQTAKHISIKQHFIREKVSAGDVRLEYIPTRSMLADALTKPLAKITLYGLRDVFMGSGRYLV